MTSDPHLSTHVAVFKQVREQLAAQFGLEEDDLAVIDTAEGETDLADCLTRLIREARIAAAQSKGIADLQKQMAERKARLDTKAERLRAIVLHAMADAGLPKLSAPDFSVSRTVAQAPLVITDEDALPDALCRIKREPDKTAIRNALKNGAAFTFAYFGNPSESLVVRSI